MHHLKQPVLCVVRNSFYSLGTAKRYTLFRMPSLGISYNLKYISKDDTPLLGKKRNLFAEKNEFADERK